MKQFLLIGSKVADASPDEPLSMVADYFQQVLDVSAKDVLVSCSHVDELIHVLDWERAVIYVHDSLQPLEAFDFVWFRGKLEPALNELAIVAQYLERQHVPFSNPSYAQRAPYGKLGQMHMLANLGLPYPKTVSVVGSHMAAAVARELEYPLILKAIHAGHGHSNYLVRDETHLSELLAAEPDTAFVAQQYIENDGDFRLLLIGNQQLIIHRKGVAGSHLNNTSQGGEAALVPLNNFPPAVLAQARAFAEAGNYTIAGVDVMFGSHDGQPYFLEINSQPQLRTGAFTSEKATLLKKFFIDNFKT